MARTVIEQISDDLDGSANASVVTFSYDGIEYTIDLSNKNKTAFDKLMKPYIAAATKVSSPRRSGARRARSVGGKRSDLEAVRSWARENGHSVSDRGRVSGAILEAYDSSQ